MTLAGQTGHDFEASLCGVCPDYFVTSPEHGKPKLSKTTLTTADSVDKVLHLADLEYEAYRNMAQGALVYRLVSLLFNRTTQEKPQLTIQDDDGVFECGAIDFGDFFRDKVIRVMLKFSCMHLLFKFAYIDYVVDFRPHDRLKMAHVDDIMARNSLTERLALIRLPTRLLKAASYLEQELRVAYKQSPLKIANEHDAFMLIRDNFMAILLGRSAAKQLQESSRQLAPSADPTASHPPSPAAASAMKPAHVPQKTTGFPPAPSLTAVGSGGPPLNLAQESIAPQDPKKTDTVSSVKFMPSSSTIPANATAVPKHNPVAPLGEPVALAHAAAMTSSESITGTTNSPKKKRKTKATAPTTSTSQLKTVTSSPVIASAPLPPVPPTPPLSTLSTGLVPNSNSQNNSVVGSIVMPLDVNKLCQENAAFKKQLALEKIEHLDICLTALQGTPKDPAILISKMENHLLKLKSLIEDMPTLACPQ
jgi:hypothetical protein